MYAIYEFFRDGPFWLFFLFLTVVVFFRSQGTYWLARIGASWTERGTENATGWKLKVHNWLTSTSVARGVNSVERWGLVLIPLSFLTWGFQTLVNAGAGVLRLNWVLYTLSAIPGYFAWALIYSTFGMATIKAVAGAANGNIWAMAICTILVALLVVLLIVRRRRSRKQVEAVAVEE